MRAVSSTKARLRYIDWMPTTNPLADYLSTVAELRKTWKVKDHQELWFRAEDATHSATRLQPGLYRPREGAARKPIKELLKLECELYEEFRRCAPQLTDKSIDDEWDAYFLMQHHGVPTRLLDWTDGALMALHFAVNDKTPPFKSGAVVHAIAPWWFVKLLKKDPNTKDAEKRWATYNKRHPYDTVEDDSDRLYLPYDEDEEKDRNLKTPRVPVLWDSPHVSRRIAAQRSRFIIFGSDPLWLSKQAARKSSRIHTIEVPLSSIGEIKGALRDAGVTESVIYPDLDGLGRELKQMWEARH
jgi:hypothetical protein